MPSADHSHPAAPPAPPWRSLATAEDDAGFLMYYYSDDLSPLPVRAVTKPGDNKSDPNLETATFGLFSTCGRSLRSSAVKRGHPHVFFATRRGSRRVLASYFRVSWYAPGVFGAENDICLAADFQYSVADPIPLTHIDEACGTDVAGNWRQYRLLSPDECTCLRDSLLRLPDATARYLDEIDRLERFNQVHGGFRYVGGWRQENKFSWNLAAPLLESDESHAPDRLINNQSPTGRWRCEACSAVFENESLLKRCGDCGSVGSLRPVEEPQ